MTRSTRPVPPADEPGGTGLPGFRSWRSVYIFVVVVFAACVAALAALPYIFG